MSTQSSFTDTSVAPPTEPTASATTTTVLVADAFEQSGLDALDALGCAVHAIPELTPDELPDAVAKYEPDVLIVRSTQVREPVFDASRTLDLVVRAGAGYDTIDVQAASDRGIFVANCPGKNAIAVAELTWSLILSCDRRVPDQVSDLREGKWNKKAYSKAEGLYGRTLGIIGLGRIGTAVARRGKAFGMNVVGYSRNLTQQRADKLGIGYCSSLINLAKMSDVVSVHCSANDESHHLIDHEFIRSMKDGAYLINTSRASVVDEQALIEGIRAKGIRAALDVFENEPDQKTGTFENPIVHEPGVYGAHHVGASTQQAQSAIAAEAVRVVEQYMKSGQVPNCVNRAVSTTATTLLTVRHRNRPGVLAHVFYTLGQAHINVEEMENIIYDGMNAACARIALDGDPDDSHIAAINANDDVISVTVGTIRK